jgi:multidrug resistance efflux pump
MSAYALTAVALALTLLLSGCQDQPAVGAEEAKAKPAGPPPREVKVAPAAERTIARTVTATGTLAADDQVVLGTKVAGRLTEITVDLGTRVKKGQVIGRLDQSDFKFRVEQAEASLQQARVRLGLSATGSDERVDPEQTAIVRQARAMMDDARLTRDRSIKLAQQELIARAQLDSAEAALQVSEGRYQDALEEVRNRQGVIAQRRSELDLARQQLTDTVILSPLDGVVSVKQASVGEYLAAGTPIATMVRVHPLRLRVPVPEREGAGVRAGHAVTLTVEGDPTVYRGRVVRLSPIVQEAEPHLDGGGRGAERARIPAPRLVRARRHHDRGEPAGGDGACRRHHRVRGRREGAAGPPGQDGGGSRDDRPPSR